MGDYYSGYSEGYPEFGLWLIIIYVCILSYVCVHIIFRHLGRNPVNTSQVLSDGAVAAVAQKDIAELLDAWVSDVQFGYPKP